MNCKRLIVIMLAIQVVSNAVSSDEQAASIKTIRDGGPTADFSQTTEGDYQEWREDKAHLGFILRPVSVRCGAHFFTRFGK